MMRELWPASATTWCNHTFPLHVSTARFHHAFPPRVSTKPFAEKFGDVIGGCTRFAKGRCESMLMGFARASTKTAGVVRHRPFVVIVAEFWLSSGASLANRARLFTHESIRTQVVN
jgi:hypothetical protein